MIRVGRWVQLSARTASWSSPATTSDRTNNTGTRADYQGLLRQGIEQACVVRVIDLWVYARRSNWRPSGAVQSHVYRLIAPDRIDGIVVAAGCIAASVELESVLQSIQTLCRVPTCAVGQRCRAVPSVIVDNAAGAAALARHVVMAHGRRRIAYVAGPAGHEESDERLNSARDALSQLQVVLPPAAVAYGNFSTVSGLGATRELLRRGEPLDALIAANDDMAVGALEALEAAGIRCPQDVVVAGFDDSPSSRAGKPSLTTVRQPIVQLGASAVARLVAAWEGNSDPTDVITLETELVLRESCGCHGVQHTPQDSVLQTGWARPPGKDAWKTRWRRCCTFQTNAEIGRGRYASPLMARSPATRALCDRPCSSCLTSSRIPMRRSTNCSR